MPPAQQRLDADGALLAQIDNGLEEEIEFAPFHGHVQIGLKAHQAREAAAHGRLIRDSVRRLVAFGDGKCDIRLAHDFLGALQARLDASDAHTRRHAESKPA